MNNFLPIHFQPAYQTYVWGGERLAREYKKLHAPQRVAESWEISDRLEGMSVVDRGVHIGKTLKDLMQEMKEDLVGKGRDTNTFPLLIKIIDAQESLSVQVHPKNRTEKAEPKTEAWIALDDSFVLYGFKKNVSQDAVMHAIDDLTLPSFLNQVNLKKADAALIHSGQIHAILKGSFILEIQQNSNTTYRLYDWGRGQFDGTHRPLHLKEGLGALNLCQQTNLIETPKMEGKGVFLLVDSPFFQIRRFEVAKEALLPARSDTFMALFVFQGEGTLLCDGKVEKLIQGDSFLIPACAKKCQVFGPVTLIVTTLPQDKGR